MTIAHHGRAFQLRPHTAAHPWIRADRPNRPVLQVGEHRLLRESSRNGTRQQVATEGALYRRADSEGTWLRVAWIGLARVEYSRSLGAMILRRWPGSAQLPIRQPDCDDPTTSALMERASHELRAQAGC